MTRKKGSKYKQLEETSTKKIKKNMIKQHNKRKAVTSG